MIKTIQEKINYITEYTEFDTEDLLNVSVETFQDIYNKVLTMRRAAREVENSVILYKKNIDK